MDFTESEKDNIIRILFERNEHGIDSDLIELINKEGDFEEWTDEEYSDYLCRIRRVKPYSCWCGYVRVPEGHGCYGKSYDDVENVKVHGGLTYSSIYFPNDKEMTKGYFWFGFDCGHSGDNIPYLWNDGTYRTKEYVKNEVTRLARQLKDMEGY